MFSHSFRLPDDSTQEHGCEMDAAEHWAGYTNEGGTSPGGDQGEPRCSPSLPLPLFCFLNVGANKRPGQLPRTSLALMDKYSTYSHSTSYVVVYMLCCRIIRQVSRDRSEPCRARTGHVPWSGRVPPGSQQPLPSSSAVNGCASGPGAPPLAGSAAGGHS